MIGPKLLWIVYLIAIYMFWLAFNVLDAIYDTLNHASHAIFYYILQTLTVLLAIFYCLTAFREPGVLLRN